MIRFLLVLFSFIVLLLLAGQWVIHENVQQWRDGAFAAFVLSFIIDEIVAGVATRTRRAPAE
jgi:hypothetical protein